MVHHLKPEYSVKNWIAVFKVKITAKDQNVNEWLSKLYLLNHQTVCYQTLYDNASLLASVIHKKLFTIFMVKVSVSADMIKIWLFLLSFDLLILLQPNLVIWNLIMSESVLWGKKRIAVFKVKVTAKLHNVNDCLSRWDLLNCWTVCH